MLAALPLNPSNDYATTSITHARPFFSIVFKRFSGEESEQRLGGYWFLHPECHVRTLPFQRHGAVPYTDGQGMYPGI